MGNPKQKWTHEEEQALKAGIAKYGTGKWKIILDDPEFHPVLCHRSNIDLKDKWRNLNVNVSQGSKDVANLPKDGAILPASVPDVQAPASAQDISSGCVASPPLEKTYTEMVFEALSDLNDADGSDLSSIVSFIQQKREVPPNFRKSLGSRLRRLVAQGRLEKVENRYKINRDEASNVKMPNLKQDAEIKRTVVLGMEMLHSKQENAEIRRDEVPEEEIPCMQVDTDPIPAPEAFPSSAAEAARAAAAAVALAENKSHEAAEAVEEAERVSRMLEDSESMLQLALEIHDRCLKGEVILLP